MILYNNISIRMQRKMLFDGATLKVGAGEKVVLRGASGSGKSSVLKSTVGAVPLENGNIRVDDLILSPGTVATIRSHIAFIGQEPVLGAESVRNALLLPFTFRAHQVNIPTEDQILERFERLHLSEDILDKPCARISGGEKQRIAILRALLLNKTIFLADEVTSALDPESRAAVMTELFRPEITLLSVSHDSEWINACDRMVEVANGQLEENSHDN
jgi:putative ABC transport system ATP-binding protein